MAEVALFETFSGVDCWDGERWGKGVRGRSVAPEEKKACQFQAKELLNESARVMSSCNSE